MQSGLNNFPTDRGWPAVAALRRIFTAKQTASDAETVATMDDVDELINDVVACDVTGGCRRCKLVT